MEKKNVVLIGMPTAGKTTLSILLAEYLQRELIHLDDEIEHKVSMKISEYIPTYGEEAFRSVETEVVLEASKKENCIIDCGGGVVLRQENMDALKENGWIVWLNRSVDLLVPSTDRPLSETKEALEKLYEERKPYYRKYADIEVENNEAIETALLEIIRQWEKQK